MRSAYAMNVITVRLMVKLSHIGTKESLKMNYG